MLDNDDYLVCMPQEVVIATVTTVSQLLIASDDKFSSLNSKAIQRYSNSQLTCGRSSCPSTAAFIPHTWP